MNIRKTAVSLLCLLMMTGCSKSNSASVSSIASSYTETVTAGTESKHPSEVTDYDKAAITSLINMDLKNRFGTDGYDTVYQDYITFTKENGVVTASGNYDCYVNGYETLGFQYVYEDKSDNGYSLLSADVGMTANEEIASGGSSAHGREPDKSYDLILAYSLTVGFSHDGDGDYLVTLVDENGKTVEDMISGTGSVETERTVIVDPGNYTLEVFCSGSWSIHYSSSEG